MIARMSARGVAALALGLMLSAANVAPAQLPAMPNPQLLARPMVLSEATVERFLAATAEMKPLGDRIGAWTGGNPLDAATRAQALAVTTESMAILRRHGFADAAEFQQVAYNVAMANGVVTEGGREGLRRKLEANKAQQDEAIEKVGRQLPPEQRAMLSAGSGSSSDPARMVQEIPDANVELIRKYSGRLSVLGV